MNEYWMKKEEAWSKVWKGRSANPAVIFHASQTPPSIFQPTVKLKFLTALVVRRSAAPLPSSPLQPVNQPAGIGVSLNFPTCFHFFFHSHPLLAKYEYDLFLENEETSNLSPKRVYISPNSLRRELETKYTLVIGWWRARSSNTRISTDYSRLTIFSKLSSHLSPGIFIVFDRSKGRSSQTTPSFSLDDLCRQSFRINLSVIGPHHLHRHHPTVTGTRCYKN